MEKIFQKLSHYRVILVIILLVLLALLWGSYSHKEFEDISESGNTPTKEQEGQPAKVVYKHELNEFPIEEQEPFKIAPLDLSSNPIGFEYRTAIRNAYAEGPNFAGHYVVVGWGCGTNCEDNIIVNAKTGKILNAELRSFAGFASYDINSRLIISNPQITSGSYDEFVRAGFETEYYLLSEDGLRIEKLVK